MLKLQLLLILSLISVVSFSQNTLQQFEPLNIEKVQSDIDIVKEQMDSTFFYAKETYKIMKEEVKFFGWRKTLEKNFDIFTPIVLLFGLYFIWLIKRK